MGRTMRRDGWIGYLTALMLVVMCMAVVARTTAGYTFKLKPFHNKCLQEGFSPGIPVRVTYMVHGGGTGKEMPVNFWIKAREGAPDQRKPILFKSDADHGTFTLVPEDFSDGKMVLYDFCAYHQFLGRDDDIKTSFRKVTINFEILREHEVKDLGLANAGQMDRLQASAEHLIDYMNTLVDTLYSADRQFQEQEQQSQRLNKQLTVLSGTAIAVLVLAGGFEAFYVGFFLKKHSLL